MLNYQGFCKYFRYFIIFILKILTENSVNITKYINMARNHWIYDEITSDGIEKSDYPDGKYYKKNITYIFKDTKEIHCGINQGDKTEELIIEKMNDLFSFMNKSNDRINKLIKIAISHYYFGYIHPFYDGNGRTVRFISSIYLKDNYSWLTASCRLCQ